MLELLREKKGSLFVKIILGGIALMFALYFGFTSGQRMPPQGVTAPVAQVNGENITLGTFQNEVEGRLEQQRQLYKALNIPLPAEVKNQVQAQVLQSLIREKLFAQEARKIGIRIPDSAVAEAVRTSPIFQENGIFDQQKYLTIYQKRYEELFGIDFETRIRQSLMAQAYADLIKKISIPSNLQVEDFLSLQQVEVKIKKLEISLTAESGKKPDEAKTILTEWINLKKSNQDTASFLQTHSLQEQEETKNLLDLQLSLQNPNLAGSLIRCVTQLQNEQVCDQSFEGNGKIFAVQLIEKKNLEPNLEKRAALQKQFQQAQSNLMAQEVEKQLIAKANIKTFLAPQ